MVKHLSAGDLGLIPGLRRSPREENDTHSSILAWRIPWTEEPGGLRSMGLHITKEAEVDKLKSDFISNVSHELRTPVTILSSYADTLYNFGSEFSYEEQKEFIGTINQEVIRLNRMVNDILDFSKLQSDRKIEKETQDITQTAAVQGNSDRQLQNRSPGGKSPGNRPLHGDRNHHRAAHRGECSFTADGCRHRL